MDELAYNLRQVYLTTINAPSSKLYIPPDARRDFLEDNEFFTEADLTSNPMASFGVPIDFELPEEFFK